ncbi:unnamed protein product [Candidula unifasciata]|uniref:TGF-beta family profile domain-containing protein n=1 Tax=Candidula unifasciata TaxID=100452 RepID=A0A8S3Z096_9EUPU|nr:unnamed protein product [Candidula unifasciata]
MIGASYCCHVTLLILLLVPSLTFANINTASISPPSSSSSSAPLSRSSHTESPLSETSQSLPATSTVSSSSRTLSQHFQPSSSDTNIYPSDSQTNSFSHISDQLKHKTPQETSPTTVNSQLSVTPLTSVQSDSSLQSETPPLSIVMKTSATNSAQHQQISQTNGSPLQKREQFKISVKNKNMLKAVEQLFLKNNGLEKRPKVSPDYAVPEYMLDLYKAQTEVSRKRSKYLKLKGNGAIAANTVRSFLHTDADSKRCQQPLCSRVHFDISGLPKAETLTGAELRVYLAPRTDRQAAGPGSATDPSLGALQSSHSSTSVDDVASYRVEVHEIMRPDSEDGDAFTRLIDTQVVSYQGNSSWQSFDIRPAVLKWKREDKHNHGLEIRLVGQIPGTPSSLLSTDNHVRIRRSVDVSEGEWALQRPLLVAFTDDGSSPTSSKPIRLTRLKRNRRQTSEGDNKKHKKGKKDKKKKRKRKKKGNKNICQRHGLYVNFNDVGWDDWIVAPTGYSAYYCHGDCMAPLPHFTKASNHAMLQARVYKVSPGSVPMVCCVPSKMSSISMLYRDEKGRTVLKNYQDMSVDECSCK